MILPQESALQGVNSAFRLLRPAVLPTGRRRWTSGVAATCIKCSKRLDGWIFVCDSCGSLLNVERPSTGWSYFEVFRLPLKFGFAQTDLESAYKGMQKILHPDRFCQAPPQEQKLAESHSSFLSEAYSVLKDPIARAKHLMERVYGVPAFGSSQDDDDELSWRAGGPGRVQNQELLMDILDANDAIDEAESVEDIQPVQTKCDSVTGKALEVLACALEKNDWEECRRQLEILQMYARVQNRLKFWEFGDVHREMTRGQA